MRPTRLVFACGVLLAGTAPALAHHSISAMYDRQKSVEVEGRLMSVRLVNPHALFEVEAVGADGARTTWTVESRGPAGFRRMGVDEAALKVGETVKVTGAPAWNGDKALWLVRLEMAGQTYTVDNRRT